MHRPQSAGGRALRKLQPSAHTSRTCRFLIGPERHSRGAAQKVQVLTTKHSPVSGSTSEVCDLVLSSGFLAFAGHAGFLQAVEEAGIPVGGVMGTSAGALAGSLYCAGYSPREVALHLSNQTPASLLRPSGSPWRGGALSLDGVIARLRDLLPPRFEDLGREFAVGVVTADGEHLLLDSGPLPEAVAASAAIPFIFEAVDVPGLSHLGPFKDGGVVDRVGLRAWRERRRAQLRQRSSYLNGNGIGHLNGAANGHMSAYTNINLSGHVNGYSHGHSHSAAPLRPPPCLVHVIDRSSPFSGFDDMSAMGEPQIVVVNSPRSGANFFDLGSFDDAMEEARDRAASRLLAIRHGGGGGGGPGNGSGSSSPSSPPPSPSVGPQSPVRVTIS